MKPILLLKIFLVLFIIAAGIIFISYLGHRTSVLSTSPTPPILSSPAKVCPTGFIPVPGNPLYRTSDFCVMKYDAKCASASTPLVGLEPQAISSCYGQIGTYRNNGPGCACTGDKKVVSTASGFPVTYIPETGSASANAKDYCASQGWHLITNDEWMTIARNVEEVSDNWCNRDGTGCGSLPGTAGRILANGHNDNLPGRALVAGGDDQPCFGTTSDGSNSCGAPSSQKRTLTLTNNSVIWDFAGNVWQWVDAVIKRSDQPQSQSFGKLDYGWIWSDFTLGSNASVITSNGTPPSLGYDAFRPSNPDWNSTNGVGRIYHYSDPSDTNVTQYTFIRAGNWRHGYDSGAFTIHLSPVPTQTDIDDVGFRCATLPR